MFLDYQIVALRSKLLTYSYLVVINKLGKLNLGSKKLSLTLHSNKSRKSKSGKGIKSSLGTYSAKNIDTTFHKFITSKWETIRKRYTEKYFFLFVFLNFYFSKENLLIVKFFLPVGNKLLYRQKKSRGKNTKIAKNKNAFSRFPHVSDKRVISPYTGLGFLFNGFLSGTDIYSRHILKQGEN